MYCVTSNRYKLHSKMCYSISLLLLISTCWTVCLHSDTMSYKDLRTLDSSSVVSHFKHPPSVKRWDTVDTPGKLSIISIAVDHGEQSGWYLRSMHEKYSVGWNRTLEKPSLNSPIACSIRLFGLGMEASLRDHLLGGTGYLALEYKNDNKKQFWHGYDKNETNRLHCYYMTSKDTGSEFLDSPKTLGVAVTCPVSLDEEVGPYKFTSIIQQGYFCRPIAEYPTEIELFLRPSSYELPLGSSNSSLSTIPLPPSPSSRVDEPEKGLLEAAFHANPQEVRSMAVHSMRAADYRPHAVCTVQTFRNSQTGAMLYMFVAYYQLLGWTVLVYDRFGLHSKELKPLLALPGVHYFSFTVFQLVQPGKYNLEYASRLDTDYKAFYKMEINWGYQTKKLADTADQDADKTRTYDYARMEYSHLDVILYVDADELFFCPQAFEGVDRQKHHQHRLMNQFRSRGVEEMRFVRIPYSGLAPRGWNHSVENRRKTDFTNHTGHCMNSALAQRSLPKMAQCWSSATAYDNFPKSADFASKCPFHYNHWSCDGMKGGGRDFTKNKCRCKVSFDMQNGYDYRPFVKKCHLMHFNDNKYRFQSTRMKNVYDLGDVTTPSVLANFFGQ